MSQAAVLHEEKQKRKKGTGSEPVRAVSVPKINEPLVKHAVVPRGAARRAARRFQKNAIVRRKTTKKLSVVNSGKM